MVLNWFDKKAKEEKELELQQGVNKAAEIYGQLDKPSSESRSGDLAERLTQGQSMNPVSHQKSISELLAEKRGNTTQAERDKEDTASIIAAATGKLKNEGLVTKVQGSKDGAKNLSHEEAEEFAKGRKAAYTNQGIYAQTILTAEQRKANAGEKTSDKEAKNIAKDRVAAFTNQDLLKQMNVSEKRKTETVHTGNADIEAFEMIGRVVSGLNKDINKTEEEGESDNGSV